MGLEREQVAAQTDQTYPPSKRHMLLQFWYSISKRMLRLIRAAVAVLIYALSSSSSVSGEMRLLVFRIGRVSVPRFIWQSFAIRALMNWIGISKFINPVGIRVALRFDQL